MSPKRRAAATPTIGTPAISRPAVELERWRSASVSVHQGTMISMHAKASMGRQWLRTLRVRPVKPPWRRAKGSSSAAPTAQRVNTTTDGDTPSTATLIIR
ncbi:hypothetical protein OG445_15025 [Streptomyces sp. NBC_01462]|nr:MULTISPECIES: hypothetical protein [unclassified Streptomyces]